MKTTETCEVTVWLAGDIETAKRWLRRRCYDRGLCVTVTPTTFIYTGGEEFGLRVGLVNYPRFPTSAEALEAEALEIAKGLVVECCQKTALVVGPRQTTWVAVDPPGARRS
jgi:hypothetical protein